MNGREDTIVVSDDFTKERRFLVVILDCSWDDDADTDGFREILSRPDARHLTGVS